MRTWSGLTLQDIKNLQPGLSVSSGSEYERAHRFPAWEWVHAFTTTCLTRPKPPRRPLTPHQVTAELAEHWQKAWSHARNHTTPEPQPEPPPQDDPAPPADAAALRHASVSDTTAPPAVVVVEEESPEGNGDTGLSGRSGPETAPATASPTARVSRRGWILAAVALVLVLGGGAAAIATGLFGPSLPAAPTATSVQPPSTVASTPAEGNTGPPPAQVPVRRVGTADDLPTTRGIDLDNGTTPDQLTPGVDVSFSSGSTHLDSMGVRAFFAVLPEPVTEERNHCAQVTDWTRETYPDVYRLTEGRNICIKTDEGRLAMLTVTKRATPATKTISLRYITWE